MELQQNTLMNQPTTLDYLEGAKRAAEWIRVSAIKTNQGTRWPFQPVNPHEMDHYDEFSFYSGASGIIYFFIKMGQALKDPSYFEDAIEGGQYIMANWKQDAESAKAFSLPNSQWGFFNGAAGIAFVLTELGHATGKTEFNRYAEGIIEDMIEAAVKTDQGLIWTGEAGIFTDSGIILFLLYAAEQYKKPEWKELAISAGKRLLTIGEKDPLGGMRFKGLNGSLRGGTDQTFYPNFEMGSAGITYTLARLFEETRNGEFLQAAEEGAAFIRGIARKEGNAAFIPHSLPELQDVFYLGYCHGSAGTARLFYKLYNVTGDAIHKEWYEMLVKGILETGAPESHSAGYWHVCSQCCGTAGFAHLFLGLWLDTGDDAYLTYAERVGKHVLKEATYDSNNVYWYQAFNRTEPWILTAETGYSTGAAGIGNALLELYLAKTGEFSTIRLPDDPFPSQLKKTSFYE